MKAVKHPIGEEEQRFTAWQESTRKDIERAFGVLQCRFKAIAAPIQFIDHECIYNLATTCLIAHNMCVEERIMESCTKTYDPSVEMDAEEAVDQEVMMMNNGDDGAVVAEEEREEEEVVVEVDPPHLPIPPRVRLVREWDFEASLPVIRRHQWLELIDPTEWS